MKTLKYFTGIFLTGLLSLVTLNTEAQKIKGSILLFDGEQQIQDDELFKISMEENKLTFYIMAKETHYRGKLNPESGELIGIFIFPDDSEHPLTVKKTDKTSNDEHPME